MTEPLLLLQRSDFFVRAQAIVSASRLPSIAHNVARTFAN